MMLSNVLTTDAGELPQARRCRLKELLKTAVSPTQHSLLNMRDEALRNTVSSVVERQQYATVDVHGSFSDNTNSMLAGLRQFGEALTAARPTVSGCRGSCHVHIGHNAVKYFILVCTLNAVFFSVSYIHVCFTHRRRRSSRP